MTSFGEKSRKFARTWNGSGQSRDAIPVLQQSTGAIGQLARHHVTFRGGGLRAVLVVLVFSEQKSGC